VSLLPSSLIYPPPLPSAIHPSLLPSLSPLQWYNAPTADNGDPEALLYRATALVAQGAYDAAAELAAANRPSTTSHKALARAWLELEIQAASHCEHRLEQQIEAAQMRAVLDRGYEATGRRLYAEAALKAGHPHRARLALMLCLEAQRCSPRLWQALAQTYTREDGAGGEGSAVAFGQACGAGVASSPATPARSLESSSRDGRTSRCRRHFARLALLRARAWAQLGLRTSLGFARAPQLELCRRLSVELLKLGVDLTASVQEGRPCRDPLTDSAEAEPRLATDLDDEEGDGGSSLDAYVAAEHAALAALGEDIRWDTHEKRERCGDLSLVSRVA
jgi:hypothetical protein